MKPTNNAHHKATRHARSPRRPAKQLRSRNPSPTSAPHHTPDGIFFDNSSEDPSFHQESAEPQQNSPIDIMEDESEGNSSSVSSPSQAAMQPMQPKQPIPVSQPSRSKKSAVFLSDNYYQEVEEQDFDIYVRNLTRSRIYSVILVNDYGKIIYSDKTGNELFEGSLNNFSRLHLQNLIVASLLPRLLPRLSNFSPSNRKQILKMLVYSKNAKRRYSRCEMKDPWKEDEIFYRFLKSITCRIRPCCISFRDYAQFQGYWDTAIVQNNVPLRCFMVESRLSAVHPPLALLKLTHDPTILKYIASNQNKLRARSKTSNRVEKLKRKRKGLPGKSDDIEGKEQEKVQQFLGSPQPEITPMLPIPAPSLPQTLKNSVQSAPPLRRTFQLFEEE